MNNRPDIELRDRILRTLADVLKSDTPRDANENFNYIKFFNINSLRFIRIMEQIEKTFGITIGDDDFAMDKFDTIGKIADYVRRMGYRDEPL